MKAQFIPVELGIKAGDLVEVSSPTISGLVVIMGQYLLNDGSAILIPGMEEKFSLGKTESGTKGNQK